MNSIADTSWFVSAGLPQGMTGAV